MMHKRFRIGLDLFWNWGLYNPVYGISFAIKNASVEVLLVFYEQTRFVWFKDWSFHWGKAVGHKYRYYGFRKDGLIKLGVVVL